MDNRGESGGGKRSPDSSMMFQVIEIEMYSINERVLWRVTP